MRKLPFFPCHTFLLPKKDLDLFSVLSFTNEPTFVCSTGEICFWIVAGHITKQSALV